MRRITPGHARLVGILALLGCLLLVTGCGSTGDSGNGTGASGKGDDMRTLTKDQAAQRVEEHIKRAVAALPVNPSLSPLGGGSMECEDPSDNGPRGRYEVDKTYWLDDISTNRSDEFVETLYQYWKNNNYRILTDERSADDTSIWVEHNEDSFRMSIAQNEEGDLSLGATSPCVWPDGVPPSSAAH